MMSRNITTVTLNGLNKQFTWKIYCRFNGWPQDAQWKQMAQNARKPNCMAPKAQWYGQHGQSSKSKHTIEPQQQQWFSWQLMKVQKTTTPMTQCTVGDLTRKSINMFKPRWWPWWWFGGEKAITMYDHIHQILLMRQHNEIPTLARCRD